MLKFDVSPQLDPNHYIPMIIKNGLRDDFKMLVDTGASIPVWTTDRITFNKMFPGAIDLNNQIPIYGFGGMSDTDEAKAQLYVIPYFDLTDNTEHIIYKNLLIALKPMNTEYNMILSFPMFRRLRYQYDGITDPEQPTFIIDYHDSNVARECIIDNARLYDSITVCTQLEVQHLSNTPTNIFITDNI